MTTLNGSRRDARAASSLRGAGKTDSNAFATVLRPTPYLAAKALLDSPSTFASRRIAAYNSIFETGT